MFYIVEVIETKKAYKPNQKDDEGNLLFDGSIQVKASSSDMILGHIRNIWAAPATFNRRIPLIGEQVLLFEAPSTEKSSAKLKTKRYFYFAPYNTIDDASLHHLPIFFDRKKTSGPDGSKSPADVLADRKELGYTISKKIKGISMLQPFEGDDIWEGRFGQSIRFSHTYRGVNNPGIQIYDQDSRKYWPGKSEFDPITIMRVKFPKQESGFDIEDVSTDQASIYLTTSQKILKFKPGFSKNCIVKQTPKWAGAQVLIDSDRVVVNAKKDHAIFVGNKSAIVTGKKVVFQSDKHSVDLDDLMEWLKKFNEQFRKLCTAEAALTTAMGPTGPSAHSTEVVKTAKVEYKLKFKKAGCGKVPGAPNVDLDLSLLIPNMVAPLASNALVGFSSGPAGSAIVSAAGGTTAGSGGGGGAGGGGGSDGGGAAGGGGASDGAGAAASAASGAADASGKITTAAAGLPTRNNRQFNSPIQVSLANKLKVLLPNNKLVITDTNDTKIHKSILQKTGASVDVNFANYSGTPDEILKSIEDGQSLGLKLVYEVSSKEEKDALVSKNPRLEKHVKVVNYISAPHFSVYQV